MNAIPTTDTTEHVDTDPDIELMLNAGIHLGHARARHHSGMNQYVWGARNNIEIIDLTKTKEKLEEALAFLKQCAKEKRLLLFVGTRPAARDLVARVADELGYPYVNDRWIGGTLTNFKVIEKRVETLENLEQEKASGGFEKYTKKERLKKEEEMAKLNENFNGLRRLRKLPDALIVLSAIHDDLALREAARTNITVVALSDTDADPRAIAYPIPSSDDARSAIAYMLERMKRALIEGRSEAEASLIQPTESTPIPSQ